MEKFPEQTLDYMIEKSKNNKYLNEKLIYIKTLPDIGKKNRWFGYYQHFGENLGLWSLDEIINMVREEFKQVNEIKSLSALEYNDIKDTEKYKAEKKRIFDWLEDIIEKSWEQVIRDGQDLIRKGIELSNKKVVPYDSYFFRGIADSKGLGNPYKIMEIQEIIGDLINKSLNDCAPERKSEILAEFFDIVIGEAFHADIHLDPDHIKWLLGNFSCRDNQDTHITPKKRK